MPRDRRSAFTFIEVMITVSLFGLLMAVLMGGLFSTTRAWRGADGRLVRGAALHAAIEAWRRDMEHPRFEPKAQEQVFQSGADAKGRPSIGIWAAGSDRRGDPPGALAEVHWEIKETDKGLNWIRRVQSYVAGKAVGDPREEIMLEGVGKVTYQYLSEGKWKDKWEEKKTPDAVQAQVEMAGTPLTRQWAAAELIVGSEQ